LRRNFAPFAVKIRRLLTAKGAKFRRKGRKDVLAPRHFRFGSDKTVIELFSYGIIAYL
jgi:hypothetical protein